MKHMHLVLVVIACTLLIGTATAGAATFQYGDVFAAVSNGQVQWYDSGLNLKGTLNTGTGGYTTGMATDSSGNLYVTCFTNGTVAKFNTSGTLIGYFGSGGYAAPESILFDKTGKAYLGQASAGVVKKFDSAGNSLANYNVAIEDRGSDWIDLAADQKTLYYTSEGNRIMRYDVSTSTQLSDFAVLPNRPSFALRILSDGGVLVADSVNVLRLDSSGVVQQTYDVSGEDSWFALNLDPNGTSFWSGNFGTSNFYEFDIATGTVLSSKNTGTGSSTLYGLAVYGEKTEGGTPPPTVPEPGTILAALSILGPAGLMFRRRQA